MAISKATDAGGLYRATLPMLGIGLCLPLVRCDSMRTTLGLGLAGAVALALTVAVIARIGPNLPRNIRIGLSAFTGAGIAILSGMAAAHLPFFGDAYVPAIVPFVILAAVVTADAPLPDPKKKTARSLVEAIITGLSFAALLCVLGGLRGMIAKNAVAASGRFAVNPVRFLTTVPGALMLLALAAFVAELVLDRRKGEAP